MAAQILLVLEGANDCTFLAILASRLAPSSSYAATLVKALSSGHVTPMPLGGGDPAQWPCRFMALGLREFHLYDREADAETDLRLAAIEALNQRPDCRGFVTGRRSLENYLHPDAIFAAGGGSISFCKNDSVPSVLARNWFERSPRDTRWNDLPYRRKKRRIAKAKRWLNTRGVSFMSADLLAESDPKGEVLQWFRCLAELAES